jgi:hypothetical protein
MCGYHGSVGVLLLLRHFVLMGRDAMIRAKVFYFFILFYSFFLIPASCTVDLSCEGRIGWAGFQGVQSSSYLSAVLLRHSLKSQNFSP